MADKNDPMRYPGKHKQYALFVRNAGSHDPNGWRMVGRPTIKQDELRDMVMPQNMLDSEHKGIGWVDDSSGLEMKILEMTVTKGDWVREAKD